ncbi:hypothetical protein PMAYCL1PPCAC_05347, partial [Pristionchus mayeri]
LFRIATMDHLTEEQMDKLRQFQDIANIEEMDLAVVTLVSCDWNLEAAIEAHLGGGAPAPNRAPPVGINHLDYVHDFDDDPMEERRVAASWPERSATDAAATAASDASVASTSSVATAREMTRQQREAAARVATRSAGIAAGATGTPMDAADAADPVIPVARSAAPAAAYESESDDDYDYAMEEQPDDEDQHMRVAASNGSGRRSNDVPLIPTDCRTAIEGTQNFVSVFEARYGKDGRGHLMPPFFIGSLPAAIREAFECPDRPVSERRPLALYIHHDKSIAKNIFPQAVLCNEGVLQLLRNQFVVWPWDVTARENHDKLTTWLSESSVYDARPIVASFLSRVDTFPLLILLSKEGSQLRMVECVKGSESADQAMEKLLTCMDAYASAKVTLEKQEQERIARDLLRKEQERELQESLAVDRERAERQAREAREAKEEEQRIAREKEEKEAYIAKLKESLPAEPAEGSPGCLAVRFRLPDAKTALRRFPQQCPLSTLFSFMESEGFSVKEFRMMNSDFPQKKDISEWDANKTLAELKWPAREVINVEER